VPGKPCTQDIAAGQVIEAITARIAMPQRAHLQGAAH
jgi:hypothetical protein